MSKVAFTVRTLYVALTYAVYKSQQESTRSCLYTEILFIPIAKVVYKDVQTQSLGDPDLDI